jgi:hypothetical protein
MADFQIKLNQANNYTITQENSPELLVTQEKTVVAEFLSDLADVSVSNLPTKDNYVLSYNASLAKYELVPADQVLQSAAEDSNIPDQFVDQLDVQLDSKIDLDAGGF